MDHYRILEINEGASRADVRAAYLRLVQESHPDRFSAESPPMLGASKESFKRIQTAYEILYDPQLRAEYDRLRRPPMAHLNVAHGPHARTRRGGGTPNFVRRKVRQASLFKRLLWLSLSLLLFVVVVISLRTLLLLPGTSRTQLPRSDGEPDAGPVIVTPQEVANDASLASSDAQVAETPSTLPRDAVPEPAETAPAEVSSIQEPPVLHVIAADMFLPAGMFLDEEVPSTIPLAGDNMLGAAAKSNRVAPSLPTSAPDDPGLPTVRSAGYAQSTSSWPVERPSVSPARGKRPRRHRLRPQGDGQQIIDPASTSEAPPYRFGPVRPLINRYLPMPPVFDGGSAPPRPAPNWSTSPGSIAGRGELEASSVPPPVANWGTWPNTIAGPNAGGLSRGLTPEQPTAWGTAPKVFAGSPDDVFQPGLARPFGAPSTARGQLQFPARSVESEEPLPSFGAQGFLPAE